MAMSYVTRKAAPCSLAVLIHDLPRAFTTTTTRALTHAKKLAADQKFANLLNSESEYFKRSIPSKPINFPFKEDQQGWGQVSENLEFDRNTFSRNDIPGENIGIQVIRKRPPLAGSFNWSFEDFVVSVGICRKDGAIIKLRLIATADDHEIIVKKLTIDLPGESRTSSFPSHSSKLEKIPTDIQHCLKKFLEMRGINRWNIEFLCRYYLRCDERDDMKWLTTLKNFVMK